MGEFLNKVIKSSTGNLKTLEGYAKASRTIVASISQVPSGNEKYDHRTGGRQRWLDAVHVVSMEAITPIAVQRWKTEFVRAATGDPLAQKRARASVNSTVRNAKALFSPKLLVFVANALKLPQPLPFDDNTYEKPDSSRYRSTIQPEVLLTTAQNELGTAYPEQFKIFLLALLVGLRRNEIDKLLWKAFDFERSMIRIEETQYLKLKSEDSTGSIEVDTEMMELMRVYKENASTQFVIESTNAPRPGATYNHYRAQKDFDKLLKWSRSKGISGPKPLHTLRKEFGSIMNDKHGIYAASRALRHSRLEVTSSYYTDTKSRRTLGLGVILSDPTKQHRYST